MKYKKMNNSSPCHCLNIRRASQNLTEIYGNYLKDTGLSVSQYSILNHLKLFEPISVSDLAKKMRLDRTTVVRNLKPLEDKCFVEDISKKNARNRKLKLTELGIKIHKKGTRSWIDAQKYIETHLGKENLEILSTLLNKVESI
ncbi:transcriptional regulator SlyA [Methanobrevibacter cuticularis]|uniref:Transcriptional regulator SlyA n=1 Tax=Methanobrevibacter cuticularis TaxID=47311 RepID=A0A166CQX0_9EURY|nr:MarR family winged helix-turn-helix transcriptional regulator [Methanobrevibacter cuticularis]KZX14774.1 transcriptional regulator SlyA [Methanobrevibacter cuticularis]